MTTPTRRIRRAQNSVASGLAALDLREARATIRQKDIVLRAVARAGDDAMLAADALRMERDAAHAECARLTLGIERMRDRRIVAAVMAPPLSMADAPRPFALYRHRDVSGVSGPGTVAYGVEFPDGTVALRWVGGNPTSVVFHDRGIESVEAIHGHGGATDIVWLAESFEDAAEYERRQEERIATLTAERDHAWAIAVALEQDAASAFDEVLARSEAVTAQIAAGVWSYMGVIEPGSVDPLLEAEQAGLMFALRTLARVPMDSDRTSEVEG